MAINEVELLTQIFDERIKGLYIKMDSEFTVLNHELRQIKEQVLKTNNRVNHLEDDLWALEKKADEAIADGKHIIDTRATECPNVVKFEKLDNRIDDTIILFTEKHKEIDNDMKSLKDELRDGLFFMRHPKLLVASLVILITFVVITLVKDVSPTLFGILNSN